MMANAERLRNNLSKLMRFPAERDMTISLNMEQHGIYVGIPVMMHAGPRIGWLTQGLCKCYLRMLSRLFGEKLTSILNILRIRTPSLI